MNNSLELGYACAYGDLERVKNILTPENAESFEGWGFIEACAKAPDIVAYMLPYIKTQTILEKALGRACEEKQVDIVKVLLSQGQIQIKDWNFLQRADSQYLPIIECLAQRGYIKEIEKEVNTNYSDIEQIKEITQIILPQKEKDLLTSRIAPSKPSAVIKL